MVPVLALKKLTIMNTQTIDTQYTRVLPRDLFNESKLLKCMGRLCLLIEDRLTPVDMTIGEYGDGESEGFVIGQMESGELTIANLSIMIKGTEYVFKTTYNSKSNYPLFVEHNYSDYLVFDESGNWDSEFIDFVNSL